MFSNPIVYAWFAWLLVIGVIAVLRCAAHQREAHRRAGRRSPRQTGQVAQPASDQMPVIRAPSVTRRRLVPAAHKPQPAQQPRFTFCAGGDPGLSQPAADPATPAPATQV
jgi:hypothetical protein